MAFNLDEVNERVKKANELMTGVRAKITEVKQRLKDNQTKVEETSMEYWNENPLELLEFNKTIEDDLSLLGLLQEETEKLRKKSEDDLVQIYFELQKELGEK